MRIHKLKRVSPQIRAALQREGIRTTEDLWRDVGTEFPKGLENVDKRTGTGEDEIAFVLASALLYERPRWLPTGRDLLLAATVIAFGTLAGYRIANLPQQPAVVAALRKLPALHLVTEDDVALRESERPGFASPREVVGRRLLRPVAGSEILAEADLTPEGVRSTDLEGKVLLEVPLSADTSEAVLAAGTKVRLLFSPTILAGQGGFETEAVVLRLNSLSSGVMATVAVPVERLGAISRFLATSEISVAYACCPE